jgi:hypothetical protein
MLSSDHPHLITVKKDILEEIMNATNHRESKCK